jgi:hypothetical protein
MTRALLFQNNAPKYYWFDVILNTNYLINRLPNSSLEKKISLEVFFSKKNNYRSYKFFWICHFCKNKKERQT